MCSISFFYQENNNEYLEIFFLIMNNFGYYFENKLNVKYCSSIFVLLFYLIISLINDCFLIKYYLPFCITFFVNIKQKYFYLLLINIFFFVNFNAYSLLFIFLNVIVPFLDKKLSQLYFLNFHFLSFLLFQNIIEKETFQINIFLMYAIVLFQLLYKNIYIFLKSLIFYIIFIFLYYCNFMNQNVINEFEEKSLIITCFNYSILLFILFKDGN